MCYMYTLFDEFSAEPHVFEEMPCFLPYHSYRTTRKNIGTQGKSAHVERQSVFSTETLSQFNKDNVVILEVRFIFLLFT